MAQITAAVDLLKRRRQGNGGKLGRISLLCSACQFNHGRGEPVAPTGLELASDVGDAY